MVAGPFSRLAVAVALSATPTLAMRMDAASERQAGAVPSPLDASDDPFPITWPDEHKATAARMLGKWKDVNESEDHYDIKNANGVLRLDDMADQRWADLHPSGDTVLEGVLGDKSMRFNLNHKTKKLVVEEFGHSMMGQAWAIVDEFKQAEKAALTLRHVFSSSLSLADIALADNLLGVWSHGVNSASKLHQIVGRYLGFAGKHKFKSLAFNVTKDGTWEVKADGGEAVPLRHSGAVFEGNFNDVIFRAPCRFRLIGDDSIAVEFKTKSSAWFVSLELVRFGGRRSNLVHSSDRKQMGGTVQRMVSVPTLLTVFAALYLPL